MRQLAVLSAAFAVLLPAASPARAGLSTGWSDTPGGELPGDSVFPGQIPADARTWNRRNPS
ncbi:hypothetical protein PV382_44545 [Streptomyces scabiei]|uniref:hypothetical protein n=1 Tax=Streptomyces scabiei TaxID=1930 RepID=UPI0029A83FB0|nr:hypothetical protein [Streptomyces scabiei]MDX3179256.1 hypothetical protein [Streptomyces scabiei]